MVNLSLPEYVKDCGSFFSGIINLIKTPQTRIGIEIIANPLKQIRSKKSNAIAVINSPLIKFLTYQ